MKTIFLRALEADDKAQCLLDAIRKPSKSFGTQRFEVDAALFAAVPRSPFAYWIGDNLRRPFAELHCPLRSGRTLTLAPALQQVLEGNSRGLYDTVERRLSWACSPRVWRATGICVDCEFLGHDRVPIIQKRCDELRDQDPRPCRWLAVRG